MCALVVHTLTGICCLCLSFKKMYRQEYQGSQNLTLELSLRYKKTVFKVQEKKKWISRGAESYRIVNGMGKVNREQEFLSHLEQTK